MKNNKKRNIIVISITLVIVMLNLVLFFTLNKKEPIEKSYNEFITMMSDEKVVSVQIDLKNSAQFTFKDNASNIYITDNPKTDNFKELLLLKNVKVEEATQSKWGDLIVGFVQMALYFCLLMWLFKKISPASNATDFITYGSDVPKITFDDIAGQEELKKDLFNIIDYLKYPDKYSEIGARMQKGVILYGPPGTGKTLTAKAIAGTAGVPFFGLSGSDFVEMYVGLGAKRVRNLFEKAKKSAPCIIFIDEIDAVGSQRGTGGNHSENDQTINALLKELDGFNGREGIITIAATNRLEDLDSALIRPGRFDRQLAVPLPTREDRLEIFKVHSKNKKIADDINYEALASMTIGQSGAMIESIMNESAISAIVDGQSKIYMKHVEQAFYKMIMKGNQQNNKRDDDEIKLVAFHEAGHAIASKIYTSDSVPKVSIVAYTSGAGGVTFRMPKQTGLYKKSYIENIIRMAYGGRASEAILFDSEDEVTTGAHSDIKMATGLIKDYITTYGMDKNIGLINTNDFLGQLSDNKEMMVQASELANRLYLDVKNALRDNWAAVTAVANKLIENESISESELENIMREHGCEIYVEKRTINANLDG